MNKHAAQSLRQHSHEASPGFALGVSDQSGRGACAQLGIEWAEQFSLIPANGEMIRTRWMCMVAIAAVSVDAAGVPTTKASRRGSGSCIAFSCAGAVVLTSQRLVGLLLQGESILGDIDGRGSRVLVFSVPLGDIAVVTLQREAWGKERGVMVGTVAGGDVFLDLDGVVDERHRARRQQKSDGMRTVLTAIAEAWRAGVSAQDSDLLQRALDGAWLADGDDLVAPLARLDLPEVAQPEPPARDRQERDLSSGCSACGAGLRPDARFCPGCGTPVQLLCGFGGRGEARESVEAPATCPVCGGAVQRAGRYCGSCGAPLAGVGKR